jgi:hypothetical protein
MNTPNDQVASETRAPVDEQRRRLTKGGLAAPIVIGTLLSRPVLGAAPYNCTISGQLSGNVSSHGNPVNCKTLGLSPGYWKNHPSDWSPLLPNALFKSVFANAYWWKAANPSEVELAPPSTAGFNADPTLMQVLTSTAGMRPNLNYPALGRAAVASWLNAYHKAPNYPLTQAEVVAMFNAVYSGGRYDPTRLNWDANQVKTYFESLYS